jgi:lipopolysaccharide biosynthesis glycosyltransferase
MDKQYKPVPDAEALRYKGTEGNPDIKIFVSHRIDMESEQIDNPIYIPVRCGAVYDKNTDSSILGDDTGDNISEKRMSYCELTVQYWAWKNVKADYYGLCHYRRYIGFSPERFPTGKSERNNGCVDEKYINDAQVLKKHGFKDYNISEEIKKYDMIIIDPIRLSSSPRNNYEAMRESSEYHNMKDVDYCISVIKNKYPDMSKAVDKYMFHSKNCWLYNCWVMNKELFTKYSEWLFDILSEVEANTDSEYYSQQMLRTPGTLGERLFGIFVTYLEMQKKYRICRKQLVFFENVAKEMPLLPFANKNNITIASNFNNKYVPIFSVLLQSIIEHSTPDNNYDIVLLSQDITEQSKSQLLAMINRDNVSLRFYNPGKFMNGLNMYVANKEYTNDMYVRVLIPHIMSEYEKVLVLDADMVCKTDVANLYNTDLGGCWAGAVKDVVFCGYLNGTVEGSLEYAKNTLKLTDPYNYCNTGVILFDCKKIREIYSLDYLRNFIDSHQFRIYEQDTLNVLLNDHMMFLDRRWNLYTYTSSFIEKCVNYAPFTDKTEYLKARKEPWILHYAAHPKPWWVGGGDFAPDFWHYARSSSYYEQILADLKGSGGNDSSAKSALVTIFKRILPKWLHPLGKKIKKLLKW